LNIPLITETTLKLIAIAVKAEMPKGSLVCPMIDARRMEVFTAVYDDQLNELKPPFALILDQDSFKNELENGKIVFAGNGTEKWRTICHHQNGIFLDKSYRIEDLAVVAATKLFNQEFTNLAYSEPFYIKSFYTGQER
jgi:tRNA threonylcarbamoyladenosine biosynthesis protein TsaB